jgi:hypothetical protein
MSWFRKQVKNHPKKCFIEIAPAGTKHALITNENANAAADEHHVIA